MSIKDILTNLNLGIRNISTSEIKKIFLIYLTPFTELNILMNLEYLDKDKLHFDINYQLFLTIHNIIYSNSIDINNANKTINELEIVLSRTHAADEIVNINNNITFNIETINTSKEIILKYKDTYQQFYIYILFDIYENLSKNNKELADIVSRILGKALYYKLNKHKLPNHSINFTPNRFTSQQLIEAISNQSFPI